MQLASKDTINLLKLDKRSPLNMVLLALYQAIAVWPVVAALILIFIMEPKVDSLKQILAGILSNIGILNAMVINILFFLAFIGFCFISFLYIIVVPIAEVRSFPTGNIAAIKLLFVFLLNFIIIFLFGGAESVKEGLIAFGIVNFMSFFLLFVIIYIQSLPVIYRHGVEKLRKNNRRKAADGLVNIIGLTIIFLIAFLICFLIGLNFYYSSLGSGLMKTIGSFYYTVTIVILAVSVYKGTAVRLRSRDYELTGRRGPR